MKALVLKEYNEFSYEEIPQPEMAPDSVVIQVKACGICGSDVHGMDGSTGRRIPPIVMGHEASGIISQVGEEVSGFAVGDRVTFDSTVYCGSCFYCRRGEINLCDNRRVLGVSCSEYRINGALADFVAVPARVLYRLPDSLSFDQAAMVEPCSIAFHAVRRNPVTLDDSAVVVGSGMIGLLIIQALRLAGCGRIVALDVDLGRLELARRFGADLTLNPESDPVLARIRDVTQGRGADLAFEAVGLGSAVQTAISCVRKGGKVALVGNLAADVPFPLQTAVTREISLLGCCASQGEYPTCLEMIACRKLDVESLITASVPLKEGPGWFHRLYAREPGLMKVILNPG